MNKIIKNVLTKIENSGFEAYIIGGYVRDLLVGKYSYDIDISTNATPKDLINIFPNCNAKNLGGIDFKVKEFHFEITTYRKEIKYKNRKPIEFEYINNLLEDLERRDFTINAICMNKKGEIIDLLNGIDDISNMKIKMIGNASLKIKEDPLRALRAIRIATCLNFTIDPKLYKEILENNKEVLKLSKTRIKEELDKILLSSNVKKGLKLLEDLGISKLLKIKSNEDIVPVRYLEGMYAQLQIDYDLPFTKVEKNNIENINKILKEKNITKATIYKYGLYFTQIAGEILNIDKKAINKLYKELPIHDKSEIDIKAEDIVNILKIEYGSRLKSILNNIESAIIDGKIKNKKSEIIKYISYLYLKN